MPPEPKRVYHHKPFVIFGDWKLPLCHKNSHGEHDGDHNKYDDDDDRINLDGFPQLDDDFTNGHDLQDLSNRCRASDRDAHSGYYSRHSGLWVLPAEG